MNFDFVLQGSLYIKMKPIFPWLWSFNDIAFMHFWGTVFGQGRVGSGTAERQKSMKTMSDEAIYQENFGFRKTNMLSATSPWIPRMKDWKQKIVRCNPIQCIVYIECELKFLNLFLCVPFSILSIEYHVNYYSKSPYFSPYFSVSWISYNICLFVPCIYVHVFPNIFIPYNLPKHCTQSHHT